MKTPVLRGGARQRRELTIHNGAAPKCTARCRLARALILDTRGPIDTEGHNSCHNNGTECHNSCHNNNFFDPSLHLAHIKKANPSQNHRY